jgi:hypothetical protein
MDALKQSLARRAGVGSEALAAKTAVASAKKPPVKASKRGAGEDKDRKAQAGRK